MANTDKKETQETQEVKANLTQEEARTYAYQIALRFLDGPNYKAFGITEETDATIKRAARDRITPEARIVTPGDPAFNTDIYLAAVTDENAMPAALKEVLTLAQDQAGSDYEKEAVLGTLFYILTALEVEVVTVNALAAPGTLEEKSAEAARKSAEENTKKLNEAIEARAAKLREAFREEHPEIFSQEATDTEQLPHIKYRKSYSLKTDSGKLANQFFSALAPQPGQEINGQISMIPLQYGKIKVKGKKKKEPVMLFYDFKYDEDILKANNIPKGFYGYEFFVGTVLDNLYDSGNNIVSFSKILAEMGIEKPGQKHIEKLYKTLQKGLSTAMQVNNRQVQEQYGNGDKYGEFTSHVYNIAIYAQRFLSGGHIADAAVKINDFTPFRLLSNSLNEQLRAWNKDILKLYTGRKTDRYWSVMQYLIHEIGYMRSGSRDRKITYTHFHNRLDDKTSRDKQLSKKMLFTLLDEVFKPLQYVTRYEEAKGNETPGVILTLGKGPKQIEQS